MGSSALTPFASVKELSKSGIVTLVLISVLAGYLICSPLERPFDYWGLLLTLISILLVSSGSAALNQLQEVSRDAAMTRTRNRPLPSGRISPSLARGFIIVTLALGLLLLFQIDFFAFALGVFAVISYNGLYTLWWKRHWAFAAVPGAIPGALPILIGSVCASGDPFTPAGWYLFFVLLFWQMPHFWTLAIKYQNDYALGGFPTLPVVYGEHLTRAHIGIWTGGYLLLALAAPLFMHVGSLYLILGTLLSVKLVYELWVFLKNENPKAWIRFFLWINFSLIGYFAAMSLDIWAVYLVPLSRRWMG